MRKIFLICIFVSLSTSLFSQKAIFSGDTTSKMPSNELQYHFMGSIGYSRIFYGDKVVLGAGISLGPKFLYGLGAGVFMEIAGVDFFTRNIFRKGHSSSIYDYDIGFNVSFNYAESAFITGGPYIKNYVNITKWMKLGLDIYVSVAYLYDKNVPEFVFPLIAASPVIAFRF